MGHTYGYIRTSRPLARTIVSYGFKVSKNYGMELTHRKAMASSTEMLWRCLGRIAERWRRERDIRAERGGLFDPRDSQRVGHCPEPGAAIPESAGGDATEAAAATRVEIGPVPGIHRKTDGGRVGELSSRCSGSCEPWDTRGVTRSWRNMCDLAAVAASRRPRCDLRPRQGNRPKWTGAASVTWTKGGGSGKCGPS